MNRSLAESDLDWQASVWHPCQFSFSWQFDSCQAADQSRPVPSVASVCSLPIHRLAGSTVWNSPYLFQQLNIPFESLLFGLSPVDLFKMYLNWKNEHFTYCILPMCSCDHLFSVFRLLFSPISSDPTRNALQCLCIYGGAMKTPLDSGIVCT